MKNKIRLLLSIVSLKRFRGGSVRSLVALCSALAELDDVEVWLVSEDCGSSEDPLVLPESSHIKICLINCLQNRYLHLSYAPSLHKMLRQLSNNNGFDIIHDTDLWMPFNHTIAKHAYQSRIPRVVSPRGSLEPWALSYRSWKKKIAFKLYQKRDLERAALLHATSHQELESFRRVGLKQPVAVIPNGINIPELSASPEQSKVNQVLYLSRIHPIKGLLNLVSAWAVTRPKGWRLIIAGPDEDGYQKIVEEAIRREGIEDIVTFCGRVQGKHKESLYRKSKLFVLPSFSENFGNVIAEALSYGLPVITTKGTPWKNLTKYNCGWWVDIGVEALADAIRKATSLTDQELNEMGIRGRHYIVNNFAMPKITEQMYGTYKWLLGRGEKPSCIEM